jgi:DHA1 family multidrug resistance protein-like MFS transporter
VTVVKAEPGLGQALQVCALIGTAQMTWGVVVPVLPLFVDDLRIPAVQLGTIISAFAIGRVIANVPAGLALRRVPARPFVLTVLVALAGVTAATGFATSAEWLIVLRLVAGLLAGAAITLGFAVLLAGAPPARRGRVVSIATIVQMGAAAIGSLIGGVAVSLGGVPAAFVAAAVPVLVAVAADLVRPASGYWNALAPRSGTEASGDLTPAGDPTPAPRRSATLVTLAIVSFGLFFARFAGEQGLIPVLAYDRGGLDPLTLGIAFALGTVVSAAALGVVGRWVDAGGRVAVIVASVVGVVAATLAFGVLPSPASFGLAIVVYAVATSLANVVPSVVTAEAFPGRSSGAAVGVTRTAGDVGAAVGPLAVFGLVELAGAGAGLAMLAAVPALALTLLLVGVLPFRP